MFQNEWICWREKTPENEVQVFPIHDRRQGREWMLESGEREMEEQAVQATAKMHWVRILIGGFLAEAVLILLVIPVAMKWGQHPLLYLAPAGSLLLCFLFGFWVGRGVKSRFVLHGLLVGAVAMAIYLALTRLQPEPWAYLVAHGLKLVGGASGGWLAGRNRG
jgi:hypothetical protein